MSTDTHSVLVSIPDCTASHVLGSTSVPLTSGTLSLITYSSTLPPPPSVSLSHGEREHQATHIGGVSTESSGEGNPVRQPVLTLQIGKLAFPLMKDTLFGTDATSPRVYLFVPELGPTGQGSQGGGYIRLELSPQAEETEDHGLGGSNGKGQLSTSNQDEFEQVLIREGLLKEGWAAIRDEIERGVKSTVGGFKG